jgi:hypothetical protein
LALSELLSAGADILGIGGALALARPFYRRQPDRDALLAYFFSKLETNTQKEADPMFETAKVAAERILTYAEWDYMIGCWGAGAIGAAFFIKFSVTISSLLS